MKFKPESEIRDFLLPTADNLGIEIVEVETKISKNPSLTVYIDTDNGVDLDTCEKFHNAIDSLLDEFDPSFGASYTLNVSSPGLDRPFKTDRDYEKNVGEEVELKLFAPMKGKKNFKCVLDGYDGKNVYVVIDGIRQTVPLNKIAKINRLIKFD